MNRGIDRIVRHAKRTGRKVAQRQRLSEAETLSKLVEERDSQKEVGLLRVWGPYQEGERFRLKISEGGVERSLKFASLEEAEAVKADLLPRKVVRHTVGEVIAEWLKWCVEVGGVKPVTVESYSQVAASLPQKAVFGQVTESDAQKLYQQRIEQISPHTKRPPSVATHQLFLRVAKRLWAWGLERRYCRTNPWAKVAPVGKAATGKPQLRIDEARRFEAVALAQAQAGDVPALGALLMIYLGLRQGEVAARVARDIDDEGRVLWVPFGKTKNARRRLKVPEHLRPLVLAVAKDKQPGDLLFYPAHRSHGSQFYVSHVERLCRLAGVPEVVPHSLRGLHATLALEGGATAESVARALGHSSFAMTEKHYASPSSVANNRSSRVAEALTGGEKSFDKLLENMSQKDRLALLNRLMAEPPPSPHSEDNHPH